MKWELGMRLFYRFEFHYEFQVSGKHRMLGAILTNHKNLLTNSR